MKVPGQFFATYKLLPSFKYCERLQLYVDDAHNVDQEIPAPHPPPTRKVDIFNIAQYAAVDERAINTPIKFLKEPIKVLVDYLTADYNNDMAKLRVIYRWITCQPLDRLTLHKEPPQNHAVFQLWRIQHRKGNYAQLVSLLCRYADIPCVIVHGTLKGSSYEVGEHIDEDKHYGEWNAVLIDKHWRLINAYWGTCAEGATENRLTVTAPISNGNEQTYYNCDENYFLIDPEQASASHLPATPSWQLTDNPLIMEEFEKMAYVKDRYFNWNMRTLSHPGCVITNDTGEEEIRFGVPKETSLNIDFQYLMFRLADNGTEERMEGYVFMHLTNNYETLNICVRSPTENTVRFELVGRDRSIKDDLNEYDWIAIYKIIFSKGLENCRKFSKATAIGWGPGRVVNDEGLVPLSHCSGIVQMDDYGRAEIRFGKVDEKINENEYIAKVYTSGEKMDEIPDYVVHRVENGEVVFNVMTPNAGEYILKLFIKCNESNNKVRSFCDYMLTSNQKESNDKFPNGFQHRLGPKEPGFAASALSPTMSSGFISTERDRVKIAFTRDETIELSMSLSGEKVKPAEASLLLSQKEKGVILEYTIRLPDTGVFGVKVRGTRQAGAAHASLYDYIIDYRKGKKNAQEEPIIETAPESFHKEVPIDTTMSGEIVVKPVDVIEEVEIAGIPLEVVPTTEPEEVMDARQELLPETIDETKEPPTSSPEQVETLTDAMEHPQLEEIVSIPDDNHALDTTLSAASSQDTDVNLVVEDPETIPDIMRRRMRICIEEKNAKELTNVIGELKGLKLASVEPDINYGEEELKVITLRKELIDGIHEKSSANMKAALKAIKAADLEDRLHQEVSSAKALIERIKKLQKLLHAVLALDQSTIMEIRSYGNPPPVVHTVMMATLLLLGHWEEETSKWKNVQMILGRTGKDSLKRQISEFQMEKCALEVAMGARDYLRDYSIDQVRLVSAGCATFYVWVKGVVEELEKRAGEEFNNIRPKTSMSKMRKRELTFLGDLSP